MVDARNVHKAFGDNQVLKGVTLEVCFGEVVLIAGRSGSGKSTLLRCIDHLETIDAGRIFVNGHLVGYSEENGKLVELTDKQVAFQRRDIGVVFQQFNLFPHLSVIDNITAAPVHVLGVDPEKARAEARDLLVRVDLPEKETAYPKQLSGGQQQRVAIARALAMKPKVMLFDEPTSALDPEMISEVLNVMVDLSKQGMTMIVVSHEMGFARAAADRVILMHNGQIEEDAPPTEFFDAPKSEATRQFLAKILR
ncbi:MAG: amino acid ABC transporter ATP-binding protein [Alphaproteobacteria bacterium]|nr:amino acid ABC transporter ATP-binding protein [Alphaproteobacteria bacterium]